VVLGTQGVGGGSIFDGGGSNIFVGRGGNDRGTDSNSGGWGTGTGALGLAALD
jgi:hypothetical protein